MESPPHAETVPQFSRASSSSVFIMFAAREVDTRESTWSEWERERKIRNKATAVYPTITRLPFLIIQRKNKAFFSGSYLYTRALPVRRGFQNWVSSCFPLISETGFYVYNMVIHVTHCGVWVDRKVEMQGHWSKGTKRNVLSLGTQLSPGSFCWTKVPGCRLFAAISPISNDVNKYLLSEWIKEMA